MKKFFILLTAVPLLTGTIRAAIFSEQKSVETLQSEIAAFPENSHSRKLAGLYSDLGQGLYNQSHMQDAAQAYEKALTYNPNRSLKRHIYLYLGKCYEGVQLEKSLAAYQQAVIYDRKNWRRHRDLAQIYEQLELFQPALDSYRRAIKYNPKSGPAYFGMGRTHRKMGLLKEAQSEVEEAQSLDEASLESFKELSLIEEGRGFFAAAAQSQKKSLLPSSLVGDWGRLVYLAALAGDKKLANEGLVQIRSKETSSDTVSFYEELVDIIGKKNRALTTTTIVDPTLRSLTNAALQNQSRP